MAAESGRALVLPALPDGCIDLLVRRLMAQVGIEVGHLSLRSLCGVDPAEWHSDAWRALPRAVRDGIAIITGPTALALGAYVHRTRAVLVVEPPELMVIEDPRRTMRMLRSDDDEASSRLPLVVNRQARLLASRRESLDGEHPAADPSAWVARRTRRVELVPIDRLEEIAQALAVILGLDRSHAAAQAAEVRHEIVRRASLERFPSWAQERLMALDRHDVALWRASINAAD